MSAPLIGVRTCRGCGCTDLRACPGGCFWVLLDIVERKGIATGVCSTCADELDFEPALLASVGFADLSQFPLP